MKFLSDLFNKKGADGLPENFSGLYKETEISESRGQFDLYYGFRCLEKLYKLGIDAIKQNNLGFDIDKFILRMKNLAEVYETGEYWYDAKDGYRHPEKVCEKDLHKAYACYMLGAEAASMATNDFKKEYAMSSIDAQVSVIKMFLKSGIGMAEGYLHSPDPNVSDRKYAASQLVMAVMLSYMRFGGQCYDSNYSNYASQALEALISLRDMLLKDQPLSWYADKVVESGLLKEETSAVIAEIRQLG